MYFLYSIIALQDTQSDPCMYIRFLKITIYENISIYKNIEQDTVLM